MQADAPVPLYCPAGQMEAVAEVEPEGQMYPALQSPLHAAALRLVVAPYLPGAHSIHRPQHTDTSAHERTLWVSRGKPPSHKHPRGMMDGGGRGAGNPTCRTLGASCGGAQAVLAR